MSTQNNKLDTRQAELEVRREAAARAPEAGAEDAAAVRYQEQIGAASALIQSYSGYPGVSQAFATMVTQNAGDPQRLMDMVQEMLTVIEQVKANPHANYPVSPAIAGVVKAVQDIEKEKPDPLNLLRGGQEGHSTGTNIARGVIGALVGGAVAGAAAESAAVETTQESGFPVKDMGPTTEALALAGATGFSPGPGVIPDVRTDRGLGIA